MQINSFSKTDRITQILGWIFVTPFTLAFSLIKKINFFMVVGLIGFGGWVFGFYMEPVDTLKIFGLVFIAVVTVGIFTIEDADTQVGPWFGFWFVLFGIAGYYFAGLTSTSIYTDTNTTYMTDVKMVGNKVEYIGLDKMTKIITINDEELLAHYIKFRGTARMKPQILTSFKKNVILEALGYEYKISPSVNLYMRDVEAHRNLFRIK